MIIRREVASSVQIYRQHRERNRAVAEAARPSSQTYEVKAGLSDLFTNGDITPRYRLAKVLGLLIVAALSAVQTSSDFEWGIGVVRVETSKPHETKDGEWHKIFLPSGPSWRQISRSLTNT